MLLGADAEDDFFARYAEEKRCAFRPGIGSGRRRRRRRAVRSLREILASKKFIAGEPMKPATKTLTGLVVQRLRRVELLEDAVAHDRDAGGHGHGFRLVVGHVDEGGLQALVQLAEVGAGLHAQLGVEVGERLVEEEHLRLADDGAADGDALALAAGELAGLALQQLFDKLRRMVSMLG